VYFGIENILKSVFNQRVVWSNLISYSCDPMTNINIKAINNLRCITLSVCVLQLLKGADDKTVAQQQSLSVLSLTLGLLWLNPRRFVNCNLL